MGFWRSIGDEGEGGSHGGLKTQQDQSQEGKESKECSSCTCGEGQGGCDRKRLWGIRANRGGDLKGCLQLVENGLGLAKELGVWGIEEWEQRGGRGTGCW
ncbi:hypothetical protein GH714_028276 [Hevea brasiliensis]|uniref:Uncharacterized protein n=1 Tax=Hevea brasiliensis TaxID=3981 RepID=A0A6A6MN02_HEVBR|nr:hypothetical protein GH714_028276 [Hevea brasiliensis]